MKEKPHNEANRNAQQYTRYSGLAFQMMALIGLSVWAGIYIDKTLELSFPIFTVCLALISCVGAMIMLIRSLPKY
jgi:F0F1-type ATP synthase assembly protein I